MIRLLLYRRKGERVQETGDQEGGGMDDGVKQKSKGKMQTV
jgi:hypothetical protein